jgi:DNA-binding protein Fis
MTARHPSQAKQPASPARRANSPAAAGPLAQSAEMRLIQRALADPQAASPTDIKRLQKRYGNRAVTRMLSGARVQAQLMVGPADDAYEREADRAAERISRLPADGQTQPAAQAPLQRATPDSGLGFPVSSGIESRLAARSGSGSRLPDNTRQQMESGLGADFSQVRVHADREAVQLNRQLSAQAFTHGPDIYFGEGKFNPGSSTGKRLLAHELTHVVQQGGVRVSRQPATDFIQRKELNATEVLAGLDTIPFIKARLDQKLNLGRGEQRDKDAQDMRSQVQQVLNQYETNLKGADKTSNHAMLLAAVLEAVARVIAVNQLNDPALTPLLSVRLLEFYRPEITASLNQMDDAGDVLQLTESLIADDPVALYMHGELHIDEAARRVRQMGFLAGKRPADMMKLLRQRFEMQMGALTKAGVAKSQDASGSYSVREATGEISSAYYDKLFASDTPAWATKADGTKQLDFTPDAQRRLGDLEALVTGAQTAASSAVVERPGLTFKQSKHLHEIEQKEAGIDRGGLDTQVDAGLVTMLKVSATEATKIRNEVKAHLADLPITITVSGMGWFGKRAPRRKYGEASYKAGSSRRQTHSYADLFEKPEAKGDLSYLGEYEDPATSLQKRGANYLRFRNWKDNVMTGGLGMSDKELPVFGAVNANWDAYSSQSKEDKDYGVNAYGDTHFVLKKSAVLDRLVYTATDHGYPRRDIYLAFADLVLGGLGVTGLKDVGLPKIVKHIVNSLITRKPVASTTQPFEVQIFGTLNIDKDVEKIVVAPSVDEKVKKNIRKFGNKAGVPVDFLAKPAEAVLAESWFVPMPSDNGDNLVEQVKQQLP